MKKLLVILILVCCIVFACKKGSNNFYSSTTLFNASMNISTVSILLNGTAVIDSDSFNVFKTSSAFPSGTYKISMVGHSANGTPDTLSTTALPFPIITSYIPGTTYTAIVYDSLSNPKLYYSQDNFPTTVTTGTCSVRFFNLIPNSGAIYLANDTGTGTVNQVFLTARTFGDFGTYNAFAEIDTTTTVVHIWNDTATSGTVRFDSTSQLLTNYTKGLYSGKIYSFYLVGKIGETGTLKPQLIIKQEN
jgi:hypothetical protein